MTSAVPERPERRYRHLWLLISAALTATGFRGWLAWRGPGQWLRELPVVPPGFQLQVLKTRMVPVAPATFQLAALVQRQAPAEALQGRVLHDSPTGAVAIGRNGAGHQSLQTCLMATGRSAVTYAQMHAEVLSTAPAGRPARIRRSFEAVAFGSPWRQPTCRLVMLSATSGDPHASTTLLLSTWQRLRPLLSGSDVDPSPAPDARPLAPVRR